LAKGPFSAARRTAGTSFHWTAPSSFFLGPENFSAVPRRKGRGGRRLGSSGATMNENDQAHRGTKMIVTHGTPSGRAWAVVQSLRFGREPFPRCAVADSGNEFVRAEAAQVGQTQCRPTPTVERGGPERLSRRTGAASRPSRFLQRAWQDVVAHCRARKMIESIHISNATEGCGGRNLER